ncbi:hypothetical protein [Bradyrhizobium sp.]|uniref:hypothetical protein n=1 Tax=Bradyrhizobium sp. TaxID=376 RepID=UPI003C427CF7
MRKANGGVRNQDDNRTDSFGAIASNLEQLIAQVRASIGVIETMVMREAYGGNEENTADIFVLDDVMPRYAKANAALHECDASLADALRLLRDDTAPQPTPRQAGVVGLAAHAWSARASRCD